MKELLIDAKEEIDRLRRQNEILGAKVEMIDLFACVLHSSPATHNQGMSIDVSWQLQKAIDVIAQEEAKPTAAPKGGIGMDAKTRELLTAAKDLDAIYGYWWDRADKPHIMLMERGIAKFEKAHARLERAIKNLEKPTTPHGDE